MTPGTSEEILSRLNRQMKHEGCHILLFLNNAPCHLNSLINRFSNIKMAFLTKTQLLDDGIIKLWKVKRKRKLMHFVWSKIDGQKTMYFGISHVTLPTLV